MKEYNPGSSHGNKATAVSAVWEGFAGRLPFPSASHLSGKGSFTCGDGENKRNFHPRTPEWGLLAQTCSPCCWGLQVVGCWDCCCGENCDSCCSCWSGLKIHEPPGSCWRLKQKAHFNQTAEFPHCPRMNMTSIMTSSLEVFLFKSFKMNQFTIAVVCEKALCSENKPALNYSKVFPQENTFLLF